MGDLERTLENLIERSFYGNSLLDWLIAAVVFVVTFYALRWARGVASRRLSAGATPGGRRELFAGAVHRVNVLWLLTVALGAAAFMLRLPPKVVQALDSILVIALFLQIAILAAYLFTQWAERYAERQRDRDPAAATMMGAATVFGRMTIFAIVALLALENLGFDVTTLLAGLGIGGIAIAIASQAILSDLFASFSIVFDKPFVVGDFIILDSGYLGTIERVGVKTTRIRSLSGEQIVISNADLLKTRIRNYKRMYERRVVFQLNIQYETPPEKMERVGAIIREVVESQPNVRFDRAHFAAYTEFSLMVEVVYYVGSPDYNEYMDRQQAINLAIYRRFDAEGIRFAYPARRLFMAPAEFQQAAAPARREAAAG